MLEVFTVLGNCGVAFRHENELMAILGANRDRALLEQVVDDLHASHIAYRLDYQARGQGVLGSRLGIHTGLPGLQAAGGT